MKYLRRITVAGMLAGIGFLPTTSSACGGFFCQLVPINQAAEQIVFRQDGNQVTAMVQIQFQGDPSDFSWVVPVPSTPQYELGSNTIFTDLESATRPQFNLQQEGFGDANTRLRETVLTDANATPGSLCLGGLLITVFAFRSRLLH